MRGLGSRRTIPEHMDGIDRSPTRQGMVPLELTGGDSCRHPRGYLMDCCDQCEDSAAGGLVGNGRERQS